MRRVLQHSGYDLYSAIFLLAQTGHMFCIYNRPHTNKIIKPFEDYLTRWLMNEHRPISFVDKRIQLLLSMTLEMVILI